MGPLKQRQYFDKSRATSKGSQLAGALQHLACVVPQALPRSINVWEGDPDPMLMIVNLLGRGLAVVDGWGEFGYRAEDWVGDNDPRSPTPRVHVCREQIHH